jgi:hypothetical protein
MIVDRRLRHSALVRVLRAVSIEDSAVVHDEDLEREWRRMTGLRRADLDCALHELVDRGHLTVERASGTRRDYTITAAGRRELLWQGAMLNVGDWFVLLGARTRTVLMPFRRHGKHPDVERRHDRGGASPV